MDHQSPPQYTYDPLPLVPDVGQTPLYTRFLLLNAGKPDDPLTGSLGIYPLEPKSALIPPHEALSYAWGTAPTQTPIYIDGRPLDIRPNLEGALRHLRLPTQARRLWVDAVCIDQSNVDERTRQVKYMRFVYKYATRVIVWLGPWKPGVERGFELAKMMAEKMATKPTSSEAERQIAFLTMLSSAPETFASLNDIFEREYFERNWCLQETVVSASSIVKCGDFEMDFFDLIITTAPFFAAKRGLMGSKNTLEFWYLISLARSPPAKLNPGGEGPLGSLLTLLAETRRFKATDPRDKIFSLLGISNEGSNVDFQRDNNLQPSYRKDVVEVYRDLARFYIAKEPQELDVLSHVQHTNDLTGGSFPSWVPKWFQDNECAVFGPVSFLAGYSQKADGYVAETQDLPIAGAVRPDSLHLGGFYVDKVKSVSQVMWYDGVAPLLFQEVWDQMFEFPITKASMPVYRDGSHLALSMGVTMGAGALGPTGADTEVLAQTVNERRHSLGSNVQERFTQQAQANAAAYFLANYFKNVTDPAVTRAQEPSGADYMRKIASAAEASGGVPGNVVIFERGARIWSHNRRFYLTESGCMGIGPKMMCAGDEVCVLYGGQVPFILRRMHDHHVFVGETFVQDNDIMLGKTAEDVKAGRRPDTPSVMFELR